MVNPYQPSESAAADDAADPSLDNRTPRFFGGTKVVVAIGVVVGLAMLFWGWLSSVYSFNPFFGWILFFFLMNVAIMFSIRGVGLSTGLRFGCAGLLTPVAMVLFVPVCIGGAITISVSESLLIRSSVGAGVTITILVAIGFAIIAGVLAVIVHQWASGRVRRMPFDASFAQPESVDASDVAQTESETDESATEDND